MSWKRAMRLGILSSALALSACMMPYDGGPYEAPPPPVYSPDESPDAYSYIDRADSLWDAVGNAPPDYAFAFEDAEPWAWELQSGDSIIVEETPEGIQTYYFDPEAEGPFLAVRPGMSFGFSGETVAVVYGPDGGAMPRADGAAHLEEGVALYARARQLRRAMLQRQRREVDSQAWIDMSPLLWGSVQIWDEGRRRHPGWHRHHEAWESAQWRRRLEAERLRRSALAEQFRRWREGGFQGPPPGHFHRPGAHGPGTGRPGRPGEPGTRPPRQPGQWGRPGGPGAGRPPRPDAGQIGTPPRRGWRWRDRTAVPGSPVVRPGDAETLPLPAPDAAPTRRPNWGGRPRPTGGEGGADSPAQRPGGASPRPPRPDGGRPGWFRQRPDAGAGTPDAPSTPRAPRGGGMWNGPRPSRDSSAPRPQPQRPSSEPRASQPPAPRAAPPPREPRTPISVQTGKRQAPDPE